jgi:4-amino-4-deoxy-L-arabinose transferase-like glycosyltransferase
LFPLLWLGAAVLFFSFVNQKKNPYLLPAAPAMAILIGQGLATLVGAARRGRKWAGIIAGGQACLGIGFAAVALVLLHGAGVAAILAAGGALLLTIEPLRRILGNRPGQWARLQPLAYMVAIVVFINFYVTGQENRRSPRPFMREVERLLVAQGGRINRAALPEEASFYFPLDFAGAADGGVYVVVDDRHNDTRLAGKARRVDLPGARRWKLFELTAIP